MKRSIDSLDFHVLSGLGATATIYDNELVDYFKSYVGRYPDEVKLFGRMKSGIKNVERDKQTWHILYKRYMEVKKNSGEAVAHQLLKQDIIRLRARTFSADYIAKHPVSLLDPPVTTPVTASFGRGELFTKKNLMIAGGAAAALGLITVLLK